jgi:pimeloyl-ACP methyl ester carboxylesterase
VTVEGRFADNAGVRIHYLDNRPPQPAGFPVLFVPGMVDRAADYPAVLDLFGDRRLIIVDPRGRGGSDSPPTGYAAADQAGDLRAVLADNGVDRFHLMTFSRGTSFGLRLALDQPERVLSISIGDYLPAEIRLPDEFPDQMWGTRWRGRPYPELITRVALEGIQAASVAREMWDDVGRLGLPTLVARGTDGAIIDDERERRYRASVPGVEVVTIAGAGHDLFRPSRTAYPEAVLEFITRRCPGL